MFSMGYFDDCKILNEVEKKILMGKMKKSFLSSTLDIIFMFPMCLAEVCKLTRS